LWLCCNLFKRNPLSCRDNYELQEAALKIIWKLTYNNEIRNWIGKNRGIEFVLTALKSHLATSSRDRADLHKAGCGALSKLCTLGNEARTEILRGGGVTLVVSAMREYPNDAGLQQYACEALAEISVHGNGDEEILQAGAAPLIIAAMRRHGQYAELVEYACWALSHLTCFEGLRAAVVAGGGVALVTAAIRGHPDAAEVCPAERSLVVNLCSCSYVQFFGLGGSEFLILPDSAYFLSSTVCTSPVRNIANICPSLPASL
jgi:hypothetical protein